MAQDLLLFLMAYALEASSLEGASAMYIGWNELPTTPLWTQQEARSYLQESIGLPKDACDQVWQRTKGNKQGIELCAAVLRDLVQSLEGSVPWRTERTKAAQLSKREGEIMAEVAKGLTNRKIAAKLHISPETVKQHLKNIYQKWEVRNRAQAVAIYGVETK